MAAATLYIAAVFAPWIVMILVGIRLKSPHSATITARSGKPQLTVCPPVNAPTVSRVELPRAA